MVRAIGQGKWPNFRRDNSEIIQNLTWVFFNAQQHEIFGDCKLLNYQYYVLLHARMLTVGNIIAADGVG